MAPLSSVQIVQQNLLFQVSRKLWLNSQPPRRFQLLLGLHRLLLLLQPPRHLLLLPLHQRQNRQRLKGLKSLRHLSLKLQQSHLRNQLVKNVQLKKCLHL